MDREGEAIGVRGSLADQSEYLPFLYVSASLVSGSPHVFGPQAWHFSLLRVWSSKHWLLPG